MIIKDEILRNKKDFTVLCKNHNVKYLYVFGSAITGKFDSGKSDIDLLVENANSYLDLRIIKIGLDITSNTLTAFSS
jgi:predicted nucleotidyltransferase